MKSAPPFGHEEFFRIRTHEINRQKLVSVPSLLMLMQETSMQNVLRLKLSVWDLEAKQLSWVLLRKEVTIHRMPKLGETIKIVTYPAGFERVFAYRDFWVYDDKSETVLAKASSTWTLLNTSNRRLQRIPKEMLDLNLPQVADRLPIPNDRLPKPNQFKFIYEYTIRQYDLDWNDHVNNVVLTRLMLQAVPDEMMNSKENRSFHFHVKNECYLNEELRVFLFIQDGQFLSHQILGSDDRLIALANSYWA